MELSGWGRYPRHESRLTEVWRKEGVCLFSRDNEGFVARGNGRAYGDAAIGSEQTLSMRQLNRLISFEPETGMLTVEAGVLLRDLLATFIPRGYFPFAVPGTQEVTVGGMIAADVHGKNHHIEGGAGDHLEWIKLVLPNGQFVTCSRSNSPELFRATIGGMGLTGTIIEACLRLRPVETGWMVGHTIAASNLADAVAALKHAAQSTYAVAWIDCVARGSSTGRSLIFVAEHASLRDLERLAPGKPIFPSPVQGRLAVPIDLPNWTLNRASVMAFNELYYRVGASKAGQAHILHWDPYFFPLDGIAAWNRIYGRRGFLQHQCVVPLDGAVETLGEILELISQQGSASFLAVLKQLRAGTGLMSFPIDGFTLAIDFPVRKDIFALLDDIDRLVVAAGGRVYLAKDARQSRETFEAGYAGLPEFQKVRRDIGAYNRISSRLAARLGIA